MIKFEFDIKEKNASLTEAFEWGHDCGNKLGRRPVWPKGQYVQFVGGEGRQTAVSWFTNGAAAPERMSASVNITIDDAVSDDWVLGRIVEVEVEDAEVEKLADANVKYVWACDELDNDTGFDTLEECVEDAECWCEFEKIIQDVRIYKYDASRYPDVINPETDKCEFVKEIRVGRPKN